VHHAIIGTDDIVRYQEEEEGRRKDVEDLHGRMEERANDRTGQQRGRRSVDGRR